MSLDLKLIGEKLKRCRIQLQLEVNEVSINTGISVDRIQSLENGKLEPTGDEILIFADFFKQDYLFFITNQKLTAFEQVDILYRKYGEEFSKEDRVAIQEFLYLCECEQFVWEQLELDLKLFKFKASGTFYKKHGEDAAAALREFLGYDQNNLIPDFYYELRKIGLHIFRRKLKNSKISGLFLNHPYAGKCILVNYDEDIFRQNFTVMHEVGHSIFDFSNQFNVSYYNSDNELMEIRANSFASNFLVPKKQLIKINKDNLTDDIIIQLCLKLKVNSKVLLISLKESKLITSEEFTNYSHIKIDRNQKEDPELKNVSNKIKIAKTHLLENGLSSFYVSKCFEAYQKGLISELRLAEMFLCNIMELPNILDKFYFNLSYGN